MITSNQLSDLRKLHKIKYNPENGHPTQRKNTTKTYEKLYNILPDGIKHKQGLDYSAGLGLGSDYLRKTFGANIESYEPYPSPNAVDITYNGFNSLPSKKKYDYIICSVVLNVVTQDIRDLILLNIWNLLKPSGVAMIGVRSVSSVMSSKTAIVINPDNAEIVDKTRGSYQKGFTPSELKSYVESILPNATVEHIRGMSQIVVKIINLGSHSFIKKYNQI